jgi:hypothetical protein
VRRLAWALTLAWLTGCSSSPTAPQSPSSTATTTPAATTPAQTPVAIGEACSYTLSTASQGIIGEGGSFFFNLTRTSGTCAWTAVADSWISVSPSSGSGSTSVTAAVARNGSPERTGAITISWTSPTAGSQSARLIVNQNDLVPLLMSGTIATEPEGGGIAGITAHAFSIKASPSGGTPPYNYLWNFGDGSTASGAAATHAYPAPGTFRAVLTVSDTRGVTATTEPLTIPVVVVTGSWKATINGAVEPKIDLTQSSSSVTASINTVSSNSSPRIASGSGNVSHPRKLNVTLVFNTGGVAVYTGELDGLVTTWSGTVTGYGGCPCPFKAGRISN